MHKSNFCSLDVRTHTHTHTHTQQSYNHCRAVLQEEVRAALDRLFLYEGHTSLEALNDTQVSHIIVYDVCPFEVLNIYWVLTRTLSVWKPGAFWVRRKLNPLFYLLNPSCISYVCSKGQCGTVYVLLITFWYACYRLLMLWACVNVGNTTLLLCGCMNIVPSLCLLCRWPMGCCWELFWVRNRREWRPYPTRYRTRRREMTIQSAFTSSSALFLSPCLFLCSY